MLSFATGPETMDLAASGVTSRKKDAWKPQGRKWNKKARFGVTVVARWEQKDQEFEGSLSYFVSQNNRNNDTKRLDIEAPGFNPSIQEQK